MKKIISVLAIAYALSFAPASFAYGMNCPLHSYQSCYDTGLIKISDEGKVLHRWDCTCGDSWWVID